jgi:5-methylcytosine-specific restriction endonuclease McrBC regulatory subunit McrC
MAASNWQLSVLNMLAVARRKSFTYSHVDTIGGGRATFIDHIALAYADALTKALRHEAIQTYRTREDVSLYLRGTLLIERQLQTILTNPRLLHCSVSYLDTDNSLNQLLHWAGQILLRSTFDSSARRTLAAAVARLPSVTDIPTYLLHIPNYLPRQFEHYRDAFEIAATLARGYGYGQQWGIHSGYGYVLNMESIFEGFVENCLQTIAQEKYETEGWEFFPQSSALFAVASTENCRDYHTRPDNRLTINGGNVLLVDAKYKKALPSGSSRHHRPENADLYQLFASLVAHQCKRALIVYPWSEQDETDPKPRIWCVDIERGKAVVIATMGLNILDLGSRQELRRVREDLTAAIEHVLAWHLSP